MDVSQRPGHLRRQLIKQIAGVKSVDVLVPVKRAGVRTELRLPKALESSPMLVPKTTA